MTRDQQEMALWTAEYVAARGVSAASASGAADEAVAEFRKRYPPQTEAPDAVWYDEPPFAKDGQSHPCWIYGEDDACAVYWSEFAMSPLWVYLMPGEARPVPLAGRRVCPIAKPQEPPQ